MAQCNHEPCTCEVEEGNFCSDACRASARSDTCDCGHEECEKT